VADAISRKCEYLTPQNPIDPLSPEGKVVQRVHRNIVWQAEQNVILPEVLQHRVQGRSESIRLGDKINKGALTRH
jgi:hypothetical protein